MKTILAITLAIAEKLHVPLVGALIGAFTGLVLGGTWIPSESIVDGLPMWKLGFAVGFLGGFFMNLARKIMK